MKSKHKLLMLLWLAALSCLSYTASAVNETEPNGLWNQAKGITLAATGTGTCTATGDMDWWRVKSTADGKLTVNFTSVNALSVYCTIYDTLGAIVVGTAAFTNGSNVINADGLAKGTYYILFNAFTASESPTYSFVPTWTAPPVAIDVEPNGTKAQAKTLSLNSSKTGHVGYYFNNNRDTVDWYKVTTNNDGKLKIFLTSGNLQSVYAQLYDNDGVTVLAGGFTSGTQSWSKEGLAVGTYYIAVSGYTSSNYSPYTISDSLINALVTNDAGPNESIAQAVTIAIGDSTVGHIGYYYNHQIDSIDWYKVTTTIDGQLRYDFNAMGPSGLAFVNLYDLDGVTKLSQDAVNFKEGLAAGTYYLKVTSPWVGFASSYKIKTSIVPEPYTNDIEPNGTRALAKVISPNDSIAGHIGFYYNHARDTFDYRKVTITSNGKLEFTMTTSWYSNLNLKLYDNNATTLLGGGSLNGTNNITFSVDGLAPGTYYFIINSSTTHYSYSLKTKFTPSPAANDPEPNGTSATAKTITLNDSIGGNISYYYNNVRDTTDWFKLSTNNDGQLDVKLYSLNGKKINLTVYDNNKTTVLYQASSGTVISYSRTDLGKGTYYVRVRADSAHHYAPYALANKLTSQLTNDVESNRYAKNAVFIGGYITKTGHLNYYYNLAKDTTDWYKIKYYGVGNLVVNIVKSQHTFDVNYPDFVYQLYSDTAAAPIATNNLTGNTTFTYTHNGLASGNYYIKLSQLNNTFGAYTLTATYLDTATATIALTSSNPGAAGSCGNGSLAYFVTQGVPPYAVQLYLDGVATGSPVSTNDTAKFTLLAPGAYYATVKSAGAITTVTTSTVKGLATTVTGHTSSNILSTSAVINWNAHLCVDGFRVSYKRTADPTYTIHQVVSAGAVTDTLKNLLSSTSYDYKVQTFVQYNNIIYYGGFTTVKTFTTLAPRLGDDDVQQSAGELSGLLIYPNPAQNELHVQFEGIDGEASLRLIDLTGRLVMEKQAEVTLNQYSGILDISNLQSGIYQLTITTADNKTVSTKVVKQ